MIFTPTAQRASQFAAPDSPHAILAALVGGEEEWRAIPKHPGYEASNLGRVRSWRRLSKGRVLSPVKWSGKSDHLAVMLCGDGGTRTKRAVHQLVLEAFVGPRPAWATDVRHLNGVADDNRVTNLAWGTRAENILDNVRLGAHHLSRRTHCKNNHEFTPENTQYRPGFGRQCLTCRRIHNDRKNAERRARTAARKAAAA